MLHKEDGTYDLISGEKLNHETGYQVSFERPNQSQEVQEKALALFTALAPLNIGVWQGSEEISIRVDNLALALALARLYDQDAIWDWENMQAINLKG